MLLNCGVGEKSWVSLGQLDLTSLSWRKAVLNILWKDWCWSWNSNTLAPAAKNWLIWKDPDADKDWGQEKGMTEDEMVGWHHWLDGPPGEPLSRKRGDEEKQLRTGESAQILTRQALSPAAVSWMTDLPEAERSDRVTGQFNMSGKERTDTIF